MPELAVLSIIAHGNKGGAEAIELAVLAAGAGLDDRRSSLYHDIILANLGMIARHALEKQS